MGQTTLCHVIFPFNCLSPDDEELAGRPRDGGHRRRRQRRRHDTGVVVVYKSLQGKYLVIERHILQIQDILLQYLKFY